MKSKRHRAITKSEKEKIIYKPTFCEKIKKEDKKYIPKKDKESQKYIFRLFKLL